MKRGEKKPVIEQRRRQIWRERAAALLKRALPYLDDGGLQTRVDRLEAQSLARGVNPWDDLERSAGVLDAPGAT